MQKCVFLFSLSLFIIISIKFYKLMLPHSQSKYLPNSLTCDCNVFSSVPFQDQSEIFIKRNRTVCPFSGQNRNQFPKMHVSSKEKLSLKLNRTKKAKQNTPELAFTGEVVSLDKTVTKTDLMTRTDSQNIKTINDNLPPNHFSSYSSSLFKDSTFMESKDAFGRLITAIKDVEQTSQLENEDIPANRSFINTNTQINVYNINRQKNQTYSFIDIKEKVAVQFCRHSRSQSGLITSNPNFYTQHHLKSQILQSIDFEKQVSSIVHKKKTTKRTQHLQKLNFKDTQSINGQSSDSMSEVISHESDQYIGNTPFSHIIVPKPRWQRFSAMPKLSNFK